MYAHVPEVPGIVTAVAPTIPQDAGVHRAEWYSCGPIVQPNTWQFDGASFTRLPPPPPTPPTEQQLLALAAQMALVKSDTTIMRCVEKAIPVPADWATYRDALRAILAGGTGSVPPIPPYPLGT